MTKITTRGWAELETIRVGTKGIRKSGELSSVRGDKVDEKHEEE